jgi:hypothetical protein
MALGVRVSSTGAAFRGCCAACVAAPRVGALPLFCGLRIAVLRVAVLRIAAPRVGALPLFCGLRIAVLRIAILRVAALRAVAPFPGAPAWRILSSG